MSDIFMSYKREDHERAKAIAQRLAAVGWTVWWDPQLRSGEHFDDVIERELKSAKCVIVVWSSSSIRSQYVKDEASYALKLNKLIPVAIDDVEPPFRFQGLQTILLAGWDYASPYAAFDKLLVDIESRIGPSAQTRTRSDAVAAGEIKARKTQVRKARTVRAKTPKAKPEAPEPEASDGSDSILAATATYGRGFQPTNNADEYQIRIYLGGVAGTEEADRRARHEIRAFMKENGYLSYEIRSQRRKIFPLSCCDYTVKFSR